MCAPQSADELREVVRQAIERQKGAAKTHAAVAARIGVSPGTLSKWHRGRNLSQAQLALVALVLGERCDEPKQAA